MARDTLHVSVRRALERDGWTITADPLGFTFDLFNLMLDLGAERVIALERGVEKIAVEVKGFGGTSKISDFHATLGQYTNYRAALELRDPERQLFLAIPAGLYNTFFQSELVQYTIKRNTILLLIYDPDQEVIEKWIKPK
jgi:XisH protein